MSIDFNLEEIEKQDMIDNPQDYLYGIHIEQVMKDCFGKDFPGSEKWDKNNPIWDCYVGKNGISPKEAWKQKKYFRKAVENLYKITQYSLINNKYVDFTNNIELGFKKAYVDWDFDLLLKLILIRFTVAKIAPKVTALMPSAFERILNECNIDISSGIYAPMAGFGGIIKGAKNYYKKHNIKAEIEAYDINDNLCEYYGWKKRDVLAQTIKTDKIVFVCPPFGPNTERWPGTPDEMYYDFHDWVKLIKKRVLAPNYIFVGPELNNGDRYKSGTKPSGLFAKKYGIQWYPEYSI